MKRAVRLVWMTFALIPAFSSVTLADVTLGSTTRPSGSAANNCDTGGSSEQFTQLAVTSGTSYTVPAGGGQITAWSTNTSADGSGFNVQLEVIRPQGLVFPAVVATDQELLPNPLPADNVQTWHLSNPIKVQAGDYIGVASWSGPPTCFWSGGATSTADVVWAGSSGPKAPFTGNPIVGFNQTGGALVDVSAVLEQPPGLGSPEGGQRCTVPNLKGTPASVAKHVLKKLGCKAKIVRRRSHGVPQNAVLSTKPGAGTYKAGRMITVIVRK